MDAQQASARFPLLFPHIEAGWHLAVQNQVDAVSHNKRVSCNFAAYRLCITSKAHSLFHRAALLIM